MVTGNMEKKLEVQSVLQIRYLNSWKFPSTPHYSKRLMATDGNAQYTSYIRARSSAMRE